MADRTEQGSPRSPLRGPRRAAPGDQRRRLLAAVGPALATHGCAELTVEQIVREAGVSRATFYEQFENKRECVLAAHEASFEQLSGDLAGACAAPGPWPAKVAAAVAAGVDYAIAAPEEALLLVLDAVGADPEVAFRAVASVDVLVGRLRKGREQSEQAAALPELTERILVGATMWVVGSRLVSGQSDRLADVKPQLVELVLLPYVGLGEARRLATSPA